MFIQLSKSLPPRIDSTVKRFLTGTPSIWGFKPRFALEVPSNQSNDLPIFAMGMGVIDASDLALLFYCLAVGG